MNGAQQGNSNIQAEGRSAPAPDRKIVQHESGATAMVEGIGKTSPIRSKTGDGVMQSASHVVSQRGNQIPIRGVKCLHVGAGNPSPMKDDQSAYYHVIAEMQDDSGKEGDMIELRRNITELEAREYCLAFTREGIDFVYWDEGRKWLNPNYIGQETIMMLPYFIDTE